MYIFLKILQYWFKLQKTKNSKGEWKCISINFINITFIYIYIFTKYIIVYIIKHNKFMWDRG